MQETVSKFQTLVMDTTINKNNWFGFSLKLHYDLISGQVLAACVFQARPRGPGQVITSLTWRLARPLPLPRGHNTRNKHQGNLRNCTHFLDCTYSCSWITLIAQDFLFLLNLEIFEDFLTYIKCRFVDVSNVKRRT